MSSVGSGNPGGRLKVGLTGLLDLPDSGSSPDGGLRTAGGRVTGEKVGKGARVGNSTGTSLSAIPSDIGEEPRGMDVTGKGMHPLQFTLSPVVYSSPSPQ